MQAVPRLKVVSHQLHYGFVVVLNFPDFLSRMVRNLILFKDWLLQKFLPFDRVIAEPLFFEPVFGNSAFQ